MYEYIHIRTRYFVRRDQSAVGINKLGETCRVFNPINSCDHLLFTSVKTGSATHPASSPMGAREADCSPAEILTKRNARR